MPPGSYIHDWGAMPSKGQQRDYLGSQELFIGMLFNSLLPYPLFISVKVSSLHIGGA